MRYLRVLISIFVFTLFASAAQAATITSAASESVPGEIIVKFKPQANQPSINALLEKYKAVRISKMFKGLKKNEFHSHVHNVKNRFTKRSARTDQHAIIPDLSNVYKMKIPETADFQSVIQEYKNDPNVEYAEPNYICHSSAVPNDPYYSSSGSWGQDYDDLWGLKISSAEAAWDIHTGSGDVVIAVTDTGLDFAHEDISTNVWNNSAEIPGNGIDDDGNGFIDDVKGWDFVNNDNDPVDDSGHGTYVTGTIAGVGNNSTGIAGATWNSKIMTLKVLNHYGNGDWYDFAEAVIYAADNGADIINIGMGGSFASQVVADAVDYAYGLGCILIGAAGNSNSSGDFIPACYDNVISVAATDHNDNKADFSNWGPKIDVAAPGGDSMWGSGRNILTLKSDVLDYSYSGYDVGNKYLRAAGTSMAASHVSGLAALILSNFPGLAQKGVKQIICSTADDLGDPGWDQYFGHGRINAYEALLLSSQMRANGVVGYITSPTEGEFVQGNIEIKGQAFGSKFQNYKVEYGAGDSPTSWVELINSASQVNYGILCTWDTTSVANGVYKLRLVVTGTDASTFEDSVLITVTNPIISIQSGLWSDSATWQTGTVPSSIEPVIISSGDVVLFDRNDTSTTCREITINSNGTLKFDTGTKTMQVKGNIDVYGTLELVPGSTLKMECEESGQNGINVHSGGELKGAGSVPTVLTTLSAPLDIGNNTITVVDASGFGVGDIITLGTGANAEGFTISSISGTTITLNRMAFNAQVSGADVYKNATVITSDITAGTNSFSVSNPGGIQAGDKILIAKNPQDYFGDEIFEVVSVGSNSITISGTFSYAHPNNVLVIKLNRDAKITNSYPYDLKRYYLVIYAGAKLNLDCVEVERVVGKTGESIYGFTIQSSENCSINRSSLHNGNFGVLLGSGSSDVNIISNVVYRNNGGIVARSGAEKINIISNLIFRNSSGGVELENWGTAGIYILFNTIFSNENGLFYINANSPSLSLFNNVFSNNRYNLSYGTEMIVAHNELKYGFWGGLYLGGSNNIFIKNIIEGNNNAGVSNGWGYGSVIFADCSIKNNNGSDIFLDEGLVVRNCEFNNVSVDQIDNGFVLIQKPNGESGVNTVYGDYRVSSTEVQWFNYADQSYASSATTPILFRGSNHTITTPETTDATTTTEVWFVTYRSAISNWEVKGTVSGLQSNRATSGVLYTSDNGEVKFTITENSPQEGDQFVFATIAAAGDANTQKKILFGPSAIAELNNQSRLTVDPGGKIELKGTADYPTLIDYDGTGGYRFVISGEVDAEYFDFNQISGEGVVINSSATITKFDHGSIRNVSGSGPHLSVSGMDHTFNYLSFDGSGSCDVRASNDADLIFIRSQRGVFSDLVLDTSSVQWDDPVLGYTEDNKIGALSFDSGAKVLTVPFKIKEPNSSDCAFKGGSFQYSTNDGSAWNTVSDSDLSGISGTFASGTSLDSAPGHTIYWDTGTSYSNLEANLKVRFRVENNYVYGNYGVSNTIPFNIKPPIVAVLSPNGGEKFWGSRTAAVQWTASDEGSGIAENPVSIFYTTGEGDVLIADSLSNSGSYDWTVPEIDSDVVKIKVTAQDNVGETGSDYSDNYFTIARIVDFTPPTISNVRVNGRNCSSGDSIVSRPEFTMEISDDYNLDTSNIHITVDDSQSKNISSGSIKDQAGSKAAQTGASVSASYTFSDSETLSLGGHIFKIMAADEVGNTSTWEATLHVVGASIPDLLLYPNPCRTGSSVTFEANEDIKVRIYDIAGAFIWSGESVSGTWKVTWDTDNSAGRLAAPGIYFYIATSVSGGKQSGKIAIIR